MANLVPVRVGDTEFLVEVQGVGGPTEVGAIDRVMDFDGVRDMILAIGGKFEEVWTVVRPDEFTVEIGVEASVREGKLTGVLVSGGATGSIKVTMTWTSKDSDAARID